MRITRFETARVIGCLVIDPVNRQKRQHDTFSYTQQWSKDAHCRSGNMEGKTDFFFLIKKSKVYKIRMDALIFVSTPFPFLPVRFQGFCGLHNL